MTRLSLRGRRRPEFVVSAETVSTRNEAAASEAPASQRQSPAHPEYDESIVDVLASKILFYWLRNRQQLLMPLAIDLQKLEPPEVDILVRAMVAATQADGETDGRERTRIEAALKMLNAADEQHATVARVIENPEPLHRVLAGVKDIKTAAVVYAASLLALDQRKRVNRLYLRYLAARLQLPRDVTRGLEQRFRSAV